MKARERVLIEVVCLETGDRAEADDAEQAILAARTLCRDASTSYGRARRLSFAFIVDGETVRVQKGASL